jgi:hypothetical protein
MIAKHETTVDKLDIWAKLSAALPTDVVEWRQDGKPMQRDGRFFARFVAFINANTVRERLDSVIPGEWDLTLELLPAAPVEPGEESNVSFKARLQVLGVIREDVGTGRDYKSAATDAYKRAAVRFGIGHELYEFDQNWVQVDSDSKFAKPLEDPGEAYARRQARTARQGNGGGAQAPANRQQEATPSGARASAPAPQAQPAQREPEPGDLIPDGTGDPKVVDEPECPKCGGRVWDNRLSKRNPKAPDYKCRDRSCDGVIWPGKGGDDKPSARSNEKGPHSAGNIAGLDEDDEIPF